MQWRPTKKLVAIFFLLLIVGGVVLFFNYKKDGGDINSLFGAANNTEKVSPGAVTKQVAQVDTDEDGLMDWEEVLWGTDIQKTDTDEDGTSDGDEIKLGRNPAVAGPEDVLENVLNSGPDSALGEFSEEDLTATDRFSRQFFYEYMGAKSDGDLSSIDQENVIASILENDISSVSHKIYRLTDFTITGIGEKTDFEKYKTDMESALSRMTEVDEYELFTLARGLQDGDPTQYERLLRAANIYDEAVSNLLNMNVPQNISSLHLDLINSFSMLAEGARGMSLVEIDPLLVLMSVKTFTEAEENLKNAFNNLNSFLKKYISP